MASNKKKISWLIDVAAKADDAIKGLFKAGDSLSKTLKSNTQTASGVYTPAQIEAIQAQVQQAQSKIDDNNNAMTEIEAELKGIRVFPNARNQLDSLLTLARTKHRLIQKARFNQIGTPEEYENIDKTYSNLVDQAEGVSAAMRTLAELELRRSQGEASEALSKEIHDQQEALRVAELSLASTMETFEEASKYLVPMQQGLEMANRKYTEEGIAGFMNALDDPMGRLKGGLVAISKGDMKKAISQFVKAGGMAKGIAAATGKRVDTSDALGGVAQKIGGTTQLFSRLIGGLAEKAEAAAGFLRGGFIAFQLVKFVMKSGDKARELNKALLGTRSLADLGIDVSAKGDTSQITNQFSNLNAQFTDILMDGELNPYTKSKEELLAAYGELDNVYIPRATSNLTEAADTISEVNKLANLNFTLQRQWGMATGELAQKEAELINEYGYSTDQVRTLFGSFEVISKKSTIPVSKLIANASSLALQSPVFGNTLSQTAVLYQKLYDLKVFGTKELNNYLQGLSSIFQDKGTAAKAVATIISQSKAGVDATLQIFQKEINITNYKDPNAGRRQKILGDAAKTLEKIKEGKPVSDQEQQALYAATNLLGLQSKRAMLGVVLFSDKLDTRDLDKINKEELLQRANLISPGSQSTVTALLVELRAYLRQNPSKNIRDALLDIKDIGKAQADRAMSEIEKAMRETAGAFSPPLQGLANFKESLMGKFYNMMNSLSTFLQKFLFTPIFKVIAGVLGLAAPSDAEGEANIKISSAMDQVYEKLSAASKVDPKASSNEKSQAFSALNKALIELGKEISNHGALGIVLGRQLLGNPSNTLNLSQVFKVTGHTAIDPDVFSKFPEDLRQSLSQFVGQQVGEQKVVSPINVPKLDVPAIKQKTTAGQAQTIKSGPKTLTFTIKNNLSTEEQAKLDFLQKAPTDPRSLLLQAFYTKYKGSPIFAVLLKKFLANIDQSQNNPLIDLQKLNERWLSDLAVGVEDVYQESHARNTLKTAFTQHRGDINNLINQYSQAVNNIRQPPPPPGRGSSAIPAPTTAPPLGGAAPPVTVSAPAPAPKIQYAVKYVRLNVTVVDKVDVASVVRQVCVDLGGEMIKRSNTQKKPAAKSAAGRPQN